jgi:hypothetical protein
MGQYYKPTIINENNEVVAWMYSHKYDNGLKLMEHSYIGNNFVETFERLLTVEGGYHKSRVVWAGDYADDEPGVIVEIDGEPVNVNLYGLCNDKNEVKPTERISSEYRYVVNHTKKQFVDKTKVPVDNDDYAIHPLPLLTCEGNGLGGGDYYTDKIDEQNLIGTWARDIISIEKEVPTDYEEIEFNFKTS